MRAHPQSWERDDFDGLSPAFREGPLSGRKQSFKCLSICAGERQLLAEFGSRTGCLCAHLERAMEARWQLNEVSVLDSALDNAHGCCTRLAHDLAQLSVVALELEHAAQSDESYPALAVTVRAAIETAAIHAHRSAHAIRELEKTMFRDGSALIHDAQRISEVVSLHAKFHKHALFKNGTRGRNAKVQKDN